jgi:hypothetical protein
MGIYLSSARNSLIINSTFNNTYQAVYLSSSPYSVLDSDSFNNNSLGIVFYNSPHSIVKNSVFSSNLKDINVGSPDGHSYFFGYTGTNSVNVSLVNSTYNLSKEDVRPNSQLYRKWYYQAQVVDLSMNPVANATVQMYSDNGILLLNLTTNATGWTDVDYALEYTNNGGTRTYTGLSGIATKQNETSKMMDSHSWNVSEKLNNLTDLFILAEDLSPPIVSTSSYSASTGSATINWNTNELSNSSVIYWASPVNTVSESGFVLSHSVELNNLLSNYTYHYNYTSCDFVGNCIQSNTSSFQTPVSPTQTSSGGSTSCVSSWECSWSSCVNGLRTKINCEDINSCSLNYPVNPEGQTASCSESTNTEVITNDLTAETEPVKSSSGSSFCVANWECNDWNNCYSVYNLETISKEKTLLQAIQTRTCTDKNGCYLDKTERQTCSTKIPIVAKKVNKCMKNYLNIYDLEDVLIGRIEFMNKTLNQMNIQFILGTDSYCTYCYDGVQNYDEAGIDCVNSGTSCKKC